MKFKRTGQITFPVLKKKDGEAVYVKFLGEIFTGKEIKAKQGEKQKQAARVARVVNLETGEEMELICNKVLESNLVENTGEAGYIDKCFEIIQHASKQGRDYKTFSIWKLDCPTAAELSATAETAAGEAEPEKAQEPAATEKKPATKRGTTGGK